MKRLFTLLCLCLSFAGTLSAQDDKGKTIDQARYRIVYNLTNKNASKWYPQTDEMYLDVGPKVTVFYSHSSELMHKEMEEMLKTGNIDFRSMKVKSTVDWTFFTNYPEGKTSYRKPDGQQSFQVVEPLQQPDWQLVGDSVKTLLGYTCHLATAHVGGRDWRAWYTEDVPMSYGPYKLGGLPGLVLWAQSSDSIFTFNCAGMQELREAVAITDHNISKAEPISWKQLYKILSTPSDLAYMNDKNFTVKIYDENGNDVTEERKNELKKPRKLNITLIERVEE